MKCFDIIIIILVVVVITVTKRNPPLEPLQSGLVSKRLQCKLRISGVSQGEKTGSGLPLTGMQEY